MGFSLHGCMNQSLLINLFLHIYICPLLLFLWRTLLQIFYFIITMSFLFTSMCGKCAFTCVCVWCVLSSFSCIQLLVILRTIVHQAPLSMGFSRQEYRNGLPCPLPGDLPHQTCLLCLLYWQAGSLPLAPPAFT